MIYRRLIARLTVLCLGLGLCAAMLRVTDAAGTGSIRLPIIMYHSILRDPKYTGKYVVTPEQLEEDLIWLTENGYTTVTVGDLAAYVRGEGTLPEKPVMLTFDDGYYNNYLYAFPLMKKYGCKMVLAIIGSQSEKYSQSRECNPYYSHVTWDQMREMLDSGLVEIQNHSYDMHTLDRGRTGARKKKGESAEAYREVLSKDISALQELLSEQLGYTPTAYVYPFGAISGESGDVIRQLGFFASFSCEERINTITRDPECLYLLGRYLRPSGKSSRAYFGKILKEAGS